MSSWILTISNGISSLDSCASCYLRPGLGEIFAEFPFYVWAKEGLLQYLPKSVTKLLIPYPFPVCFFLWSELPRASYVKLQLVKPERRKKKV